MSIPHLSLQDVCHLQLAAQGLLTPRRARATPADLLACIRRMALLQIDTISVVARSPYLVLFSRLGHYDPRWLEQLLADGDLFEYWAHEACFVPREDYRLLRHRMLDPAAMGWKFSAQCLKTHGGEIAQIVERIRQDGPVRAADFERKGGKGNGWWDWKPEKRHLEVLFTAGQLMVRERRNFQRVYDLAERVMPEWNDERDLPSPDLARRDMVRASCRALGLVKTGWVADYYRLKRGKYDALLHQLADEGELLPVRVEGWQHGAFVHASLADELVRAQAGSLKASHTAVLSPFDPLVWDRKRASELFGFDYRIECYTPAPKRQYGYFVLPLLHRGKLVGRMDAKAHRKEGVFEVKSLYLEDGVRVTRTLAQDLGKAIQKLAQWHQTPLVRYGNVPAPLLAQWQEVAR
ncbi:winged helix-turn-helix domain-containing protein [Aeromonas caviae]|uniref:Winged helix-turn-helix domain-containing protein n=1 Tax=Aeromonas caviae TaxID=648 RepID=A0A7U5Y5K5_AERCA|nr:winged helix-turn-helix domain-containing protein [Aeromonas caviae]AXB04103.1 winged helix-turn-helix domain-containing protein [Aeromonas caviae]MBL0438606.1 YcaQ family DNA glycosylase [Aeromonas caviae]MDX7644937.1 winged helix-turn-helix domain-containing protein [Aeromonas caviae]RQX17581.1 winged helix-turn-helix domain-containing protein [Aeromonas caviae]